MFAREIGVALVVLAAVGSTAAQDLGADLIQRRCVACHGEDLIRQQRLTRDGWSRELDKMVAWGAAVTPEERPLLLDALTGRVLPTAQDAVATILLETRCEYCHGPQLIAQQRLDAAGWTRVIDDMIAWGATANPAEKAALAAMLVQRRAGVLPYRP